MLWSRLRLTFTVRRVHLYTLCSTMGQIVKDIPKMAGDCEDTRGRIPSKAKEFYTTSCTHGDLNPSIHYGSINIHNRINITSPNGPFTWVLGTRGNLATSKLQQKRNCNNKSLDFGGGKLKQHTHTTNSIALLGKHRSKHLLHQTSNSSDQKKNQIAFDQLRRTLQQLQTVTKITGATSLLWPHWCLGASTQSLQASVKISVSHTVGLLYRQGPKALGTSESSRLQEQLWSSGWEPHSWAQLTCPALPSAECHARWISS